MWSSNRYDGLRLRGTSLIFRWNIPPRIAAAQIQASLMLLVCWVDYDLEQNEKFKTLTHVPLFRCACIRLGSLPAEGRTNKTHTDRSGLRRPLVISRAFDTTGSLS